MTNNVKYVLRSCRWSQRLWKGFSFFHYVFHAFLLQSTFHLFLHKFLCRTEEKKWFACWVIEQPQPAVCFSPSSVSASVFSVTKTSIIHSRYFTHCKSRLRSCFHSKGRINIYCTCNQTQTDKKKRIKQQVRKQNNTRRHIQRNTMTSYKNVYMSTLALQQVNGHVCRM